MTDYCKITHDLSLNPPQTVRSYIFVFLFLKIPTNTGSSSYRISKAVTELLEKEQRNVNLDVIFML